MAETLTPIDRAPWIKTGNLTQVPLNQQFTWESESIIHPLKIHERNERIVDIKTGEVLARYVDFNTGVGNPLVADDSLRDYKWWLKADSCERGQHYYKKMKFNTFKNNSKTIMESN